MGVVAQKMLRGGTRIGEVAAPSTRDADLFGDLGVVVDQQDFEPTLACLAGAEQAGSPGPNDHCIELKHSRAV